MELIDESDDHCAVPRCPRPVSFSGDRGEFRRLVTRGAGLELVTVGFYRFWLATDIRRHLWSNTHVDGDAAEYTGRGKELLIGFLFALAILCRSIWPISWSASRPSAFKAFASFPLLAFFYVFGQFAIYRARRYRLTRTVWRGVRFWMKGSGWAYAARAALWGLLVIAHLGPAAAVARGGARALQDAAFLLWRSAGQFRGPRLGFLQARLVAVAAGADRPLCLSAGALRLWRVQGGGMALVDFGHPFRRRAPGIEVAAAAH